jgi:hypothetical protein
MIRRMAIANVAIALVLAPNGASAAPRRHAPPAAAAGNALIDALAACRALTEAAARLACYDEASARLAQAVDRKDVVVLDRQEISQTRRSLFGFSLPRIALFRGDTAEEQSEIVAKVASVRELGNGKWQIRLEDGAVWETTEASMAVNDPRPGDEVKIKRAALGGYMIRIAGQRVLRARRVG